MSNFIILPTQLFSIDILKLNKKYKYYLWEHPHYFKSYNYNKKKLILHRSSMLYYFDYLKKNKFDVTYINFYDNLPNIDSYYIIDPIDNIELPNKDNIIEIYESPNFLGNKNLYELYRNKTDKFIFNNFYMFMKNELNILPNVKSKDKDNRKRLPNDVIIPDLMSNNEDRYYIEKAIIYINKHFPNNYGNTFDFIFPISHNSAEKWLNDFIDKKLIKFGDYEDFVSIKNDYLFHSVLSSSINIGLLNPNYIIEKIINLKKIPMNSLEGYIRQLFWREYQRYTYIYINFDNKNYFGNNKKLSLNWYNGSTGILPIDDCIISAFNSGYLHHIRRLMFIGNYMNLEGISPKEGFKWFMEFSCDSYEWVMKQNVLDMVFFVTGGETMRKPYVSSSNYILNMSNYKKGEWTIIWDKKYNNFLKKNKNKLWKYRYHFRGLKNI